MLLFLLVLQLGTCEAAAPTNVYILAGQSNMAGRGGVIPAANKWDGVIPAECEPNPSVFRFNQNSTWEEAREPLHAGIDNGQVNGIGPGMPFATSVLKNDPLARTVGLVPCAIGGSALSKWQKEGGAYYPTLIDRARAATRDGGTIRALLWYQGESDTRDLKLTQSYGARFDQFVTDVRTELNIPSLPVIQVALASGWNFTGIVRAAQLESRLPNVKCVDAMGLELSGWDHLHLTTQSQVILGNKMAQCFLTDHC